MRQINRRYFLAVAASMTACRKASSITGGFIAFSLGAAERILKSSSIVPPEVASLAGITSATGLVHDSVANDVILTGKLIQGAEPLALNDLISAIRARVVHHAWPLVTIERTAETPKSGMQQVLFEGGIANSAFGAQLLAADVVLKHTALGLAHGSKMPFPSYFDICARQMAKAPLGSAVSRFWFYAADAALLARDDVYAVRDLKLGVKAVSSGDTTAEDELAIRFAADFGAAFPAVEAISPEVAKLRPLFNLVAIAHGLEKSEWPGQAFWAESYKLPSTPTPSQYEVVRRSERVSARGGELQLQLNGGVDTRVFVRRLRDGDARAFEEAVLRTRPNAGALWWPVPLSAWMTEAATVDPVETALLSKMPGTTIERNTAPVGTPLVGPSTAAPPQVDRGGVWADIPVSEKDFRRK